MITNNKATFLGTYEGPQEGASIPSSRTKSSLNLVMPMVILGIPYPVHTFNPESRPNFALKSRIPALKSRIPKTLLGSLTYHWGVQTITQ